MYKKHKAFFNDLGVFNKIYLLKIIKQEAQMAQHVGLPIFIISSLLYAPSVQAMQFDYNDWTFNAGGSFTALYGLNSYEKQYESENNWSETYSGLTINLSAAYNITPEYQVGAFYSTDTDGTNYLHDYDLNEWDEQFYGFIKSPYGQLQIGQNYNVGYLFYVGAPTTGPLYVNDSTVTNFLNNPNWNSTGGKRAAYLTLNSTQLDTDNVAAKINYISPTFYGTQFGFSYMPKAYVNQGLINGYAPYHNEDAYVVALSNTHNFGEVTLNSYLAYGLYAKDDNDYAAGLSLAWRNWTLGGSFRRTTVDGDRYPINRQINSYMTAPYFDNFREGKAWNIGASYTYGKLTTAVTYFEAEADLTANKDQYLQWTNQYQYNKYLSLFATIAHVSFTGVSNSASDSNKGYSYITGFTLSI